MTHQVTDKELLQELAAKPIGGKHLQGPKPRGNEKLFDTEAVEAAKRADKKWLPAGKLPPQTPESRAREAELRATQTDIEDAVEAAGGHRGGRHAPH